MVFFTCQHCGTSLKKNQVEKHFNYERACGQRSTLTCVDCLKDFIGNAYIAHTSCITEDEKYSAKGFKSKQPSDKGAKKQHSWINSVRETAIQPGMSNVQVRIINHCHQQENVPQKRLKFQNFCKSLFVGNKRLNLEEVDAIFHLFDSTHKKNTELDKLVDSKGENTNSSKSKQNGTAKKEESENGRAEDRLTDGDENVHLNGKKKLNKHERKELKKRVRIESENIENDSNISENYENENIENEVNTKKKQRGKIENDEEENERSLDENGTNGHESGKEAEKKLTKKERKEMKKRKKFEAEIDEIENYQKPDDDAEENCNDGEEVKKKEQSKKKRNTNGEQDGDEGDDGSKKKKKKRGREPEIEGEEPVQKKSKADCASQDNGTTDNDDTGILANKNTFKWDEVILNVLRSKGNELPIKRLSKKVIAEYQSTQETHWSFEEISAKFNKKLRKIPGVKVLKDRAKLVE